MSKRYKLIVREFDGEEQKARYGIDINIDKDHPLYELVLLRMGLDDIYRLLSRIIIERNGLAEPPLVPVMEELDNGS